MGYLQTSSSSGGYDTATYVDLTGISLHADTEKIVIVCMATMYDWISEPQISSIVWDYGGAGESLTHIAGTHRVQTTAGDRSVITDIWYLDNPTVGSSKTVRVTWNTYANDSEMYILVYQFDDEGESGASGDYDIGGANSVATVTLDLTTRDTDSFVVICSAHNVYDANPFSPLTDCTMRLDSDIVRGCYGSASRAGTGGTDTIGYTCNNARMGTYSAYEVLISTPSADVFSRGMSGIEQGVIASQGGGHSGLHPIGEGYIA